MVVGRARITVTDTGDGGETDPLRSSSDRRYHRVSRAISVRSVRGWWLVCGRTDAIDGAVFVHNSGTMAPSPSR